MRYLLIIILEQKSLKKKASSMESESEDYSSDPNFVTPTTMVSRSAAKQNASKSMDTIIDISDHNTNSSVEEEPLSFNETETSQSDEDSEIQLDEDSSDNIDIDPEIDMIDNSIGEDNAEDIETVQQILGEKDTYNPITDLQNEDDQAETLYFAKFANKSYKHCKWMTEMDLVITAGGENCLKRYKNKVHKNPLTHSQSIPSLQTTLLTFDETFVNPQWFEVDRVIDDRIVNGKRTFLVKWKELEYEEATWEEESFIKNKPAIDAYFERRKHSSPKKIPSRWTRPPPELFKPIKEPPVSKTNFVLRDYQLEGLNWLRYCWYNRRNSILADEMGLGKTVQIVTTLNDLKNSQNINGPFLIVAPLSTLPHWKNEFESWSDFNTIIYHGSTMSRQIIESSEFNVKDDLGNVLPNRIGVDVVITTYETISKSFNFFNSVEWRYLVADEGHKLKNYKGKRYQIMQKLSFEHCTLLTGTPIQNGMTELWSLLHFLSPEKFNDIDGFMAKYGNMRESSQVQEVQSIIKPLLLRRKKIDVEKSLAPKEETIIEVELTRIQKTFYRAFIHQNAPTLLQQITVGSLPSLQNLMMQLRKVCNHPFLIKGAEEGIVNEIKNSDTENKLTNDEVRNKALIESSGKMVLLSKLLPKLKADGHKVLIFSQMVRVLDIIESYLNRNNYQFERIDGSLNENDRRNAIERFNSDADNFVFLLSTKAGGVGINLASADTVIIYDSDWNPQNDIQAQARCHRIGQTAKVKVYRLISRGTYENEMFERASKKLGLDHVVLDGGNMKQAQPMKPDEIEKILRKGAYGIFQDDNSKADDFVTADIDEILENCSRSHIMDASGDGSAFSKATFQTDENNAAFWSKVIPEKVTNIKQYGLNKIRDLNNLRESDISEKTRKCRKDRLDQEDDLDDTENGFRIVHSLIDNGFTNTSAERKVLRIASTIKHPEDIESISILHKILHCNTSDQSEDENNSNDEDIEFDNIDELVQKYGEITLTVIDKADKIISRVAFFARLRRAVYFIQGNSKFKWPEIQPVWEDPFCEYSLMVGLLKYGWKNINKIYDDEDMLLMNSKRLSPPQIENRVYGLIEILETQFDDSNISLIPPSSFVPMPPLEWREKFISIHTRKSLYSHELTKLFNSIRYYGIKEKPSGKIDMKEVKETADLQNVPDEIISNAIENLKLLTSTVKTETDTINFDGFPDLEPLKSRITAKDAISFSRAIKVMHGVNTFVNNYCELSDEFVKKAPKNPHLPSWWTPEHDTKMIFAVHQYGTAVVSSWIVDPNFPFRAHIDDKLLKSFEKAANKEKKKGNKIVRPQKLGDFQFIYRKRSRLARIITVVDYVNAKIEKNLSKKFSSQYELVASSSLRIVSFGKYLGNHSRFGVCPVGYVCERLYGDSKKDWYRCEIQADENDRLLFSVEKMKKRNDESSDDADDNADNDNDNEQNENEENMSNEENSSLNANDSVDEVNSTPNGNENDDNKCQKFVANSPITAWKLALTADGKSNLRIVGMYLFGLSNKKVKSKLNQMEIDYKKEHPDEVKEEAESTSHASDAEDSKNTVKQNKGENGNARNFTIKFMRQTQIIDFIIPVSTFGRELVHEANMDEVEATVD